MYKKFLCFIFAMLVILIAGCEQTSSESFSFTYAIEPDNIVRGERIGIAVTLVNNSEKEYVYTGAESDFRATVKLYCNSAEAEYVIPTEPVPSTDDSGKHVVAPHESKTFTFYFLIPADASQGDYNLDLSYKETKVTYNNVFTLED